VCVCVCQRLTESQFSINIFNMHIVTRAKYEVQAIAGEGNGGMDLRDGK